MSVKILCYDLESTPIKGYSWRRYDTNLIGWDEVPQILCFGYTWLDTKTPKAKVISQCDFEDYVPGELDDYNVTYHLHQLMQEADILLHHNGDKFDLKFANARYAFHDLDPLPKMRTIDTLKILRKEFNLVSNRLGDACRYFGLGDKYKHSGMDTWFGCMEGDEESWKTMIKYGGQDVDIMVDLYEYIKPYITNHPNLGLYGGAQPEGSRCCQICGTDEHTEWRGYRYTQVSKFHRFFCRKCRRSGSSVSRESGISSTNC